MVLGHVEGDPVNARHVEYHMHGLVVLLVVFIDLPQAPAQERPVNLHSVPLLLHCFIVEEVAAVALHLRNQQRQVIGLELVGPQQLAIGSIEVIIHRPGTLPSPLGMVAVEPAEVVNQVVVPVYQVVLPSLPEVVLARVPHHTQGCLLLGQVQIVEVDH